MADRYLLESGSPDGYFLEDGTGVLLLNNSVAWEWDNSSHFFTLSSDGLTATRLSSAGHAMVRAGLTLASGSFTVTPSVIVGNIVVGFTDLSQSSGDWVGDSVNGIGYAADGNIYNNGASVVGSLATFTAADVIKAEISGGKFFAYKNGSLQNAGGTTLPVGLTSPYPATSTNGNGDVFAADFTGWAANLTHATTGVLTGPGSTIAGTAAHIAIHGTTGALTGPGSTIAGTAAHIAIHTSTGALTGPGSTIAGSAARTREHATTGVLTGPGSTIVGVAVYNAKHTTSGALTGPGSVVVGAAARTRAHATTGVLTGPGSTIAGTAVYNAKHTTSGSLTGPGSTLAGSATRFRAFATSGVLVGLGSTIAGAADHGSSVVSHATSGALVGQPSIVVGTAARTRQHATSGALTGPPAFIFGYATRWRDHDSSGVLLGVTGVVFGRVFNGTPQLHDIPVDSDNLTGEVASPAANLGSISEPSGQIVNHPPYPPA